MTREVLIGSKMIGKFFGRSGRQIQRWYAEKRLPGAYKIGKNGPLTMARADAIRVREGFCQPVPDESISAAHSSPWSMEAFLFLKLDHNLDRGEFARFYREAMRQRSLAQGALH